MTIMYRGHHTQIVAEGVLPHRGKEGLAHIFTISAAPAAQTRGCRPANFGVHKEHSSNFNVCTSHLALVKLQTSAVVV